MTTTQNDTNTTSSYKGRVTKCEVILKEIWSFYNAPLHAQLTSEFDLDESLNFSLYSIAHRLKVNLPIISQHANILILGNTSVGKSTFVNWYLQDDLQKTGMAAETQYLTLLTSGTINTYISTDMLSRNSSQYKALFEKYKGLDKHFNIKCINTEKNENIKYINFIDTPSINDSKVSKLFNFSNILFDIAALSDLILVFFDPIGQASGTRLLKTIKQIYENFGDKTKFCLTKIDDIPSESERLKILSQITQNIVTYVTTSPGIEIFPIFIPHAKSGLYLLPSQINESETSENAQTQLINRINEIKSNIDFIIEEKVKSLFVRLRKDCELLKISAQEFMTNNSKFTKSFTSSRKERTLLFKGPFFFIFALMISGFYFTGYIEKYIGELSINFPIFYEWQQKRQK